MNNNETIFALSSGHGKSGVAVIRISGTNLGQVFSKFINKTDFLPRHTYFSNLKDSNNNLIDQVICIYFRAPHSFTGEDVIEIHCHGASAVIEKIFSYLTELEFRMATPGEFSKRAFYNNKMDLADIDGLVALLDAQTEKQRQSAIKSMLGTDSKHYESWRKQMIEISAYAAAILDYPEDELPQKINEKIRSKTENLYKEINDTISRYMAVRAIRNGFNIVLIGDVNVGKSSLFNLMVGASRAIVSEIPGTTRDVVSAQLDIDGYLINLSDTAGIRNATDTVEKIGIEKTKSEIENADLVLRVFDASNKKNLLPETKENEILIFNKSDLIKQKENKKVIYISTKTGEGINDLMSIIKERLNKITHDVESSIAVNTRTKKLLTDSATELKDALNTPKDNYDIFSEHVRRAADNIGKILGTITATEVMDATFSQLCLGK